MHAIKIWSLFWAKVKIAVSHQLWCLLYMSVFKDGMWGFGVNSADSWYFQCRTPVKSVCSIKGGNCDVLLSYYLTYKLTPCTAGCHLYTHKHISSFRTRTVYNHWTWTVRLMMCGWIAYGLYEAGRLLPWYDAFTGCRSGSCANAEYEIIGTSQELAFRLVRFSLSSNCLSQKGVEVLIVWMLELLANWMRRLPVW
jgi:hypothetical protein